MKNVDYIVVGCGLAGIAFCELLREHQKTFLVFDDSSHKASSVAVGLYNPVVLKRFTAISKAKELLDLIGPKYKTLETLLNIELIYELPVYRKFSSVEEQNQWFSATDKQPLKEFLLAQIFRDLNPKIKAPFGYGKVLKSGRIDTGKLVDLYQRFLENNGFLIRKPFKNNKIDLKEDGILYEDITAKYIVFAEGLGITYNPFFKDLPLNPVKGEIIIVKALDLKMDFNLKSSVFVVPIGKDLYAVGATYNWTDMTNNPTTAGKEELITKLRTLIDCDFEVIDHRASLRPTVIDRRPLVGAHSNYSRLFVLNGLGTRGVMIAPYVAKQLYDFIEYGTPLDKEIDIKRFS